MTWPYNTISQFCKDATFLEFHLYGLYVLTYLNILLSQKVILSMMWLENLTQELRVTLEVSHRTQKTFPANSLLIKYFLINIEVKSTTLSIQAMSSNTGIPKLRVISITASIANLYRFLHVAKIHKIPPATWHRELETYLGIRRFSCIHKSHSNTNEPTIY